MVYYTKPVLSLFSNAFKINALHLLYVTETEARP